MVAVKADGFHLLISKCYRMVVAVSKQKEELLSECLIVDDVKVEYVFRKKDQNESDGSWVVRLQVGCNDAVDGCGLQVVEVESSSPVFGQPGVVRVAPVYRACPRNTKCARRK